MTDQLNEETTDEATETTGINRRRMFIAGAGLAGAAALAKTGTASAADDDEVLVGNPDNVTNDGATVITNTNNTDTVPGTPGQEAIVGVLTGTDNGSHAVRGFTAGVGHAVAGTVSADNENNSVAATWGKHDNGLGAGVGGVNGASDVDLAGPARGVEGIVLNPSNGSHAVYGEARGAGHSVAGDTPAMVPDADGSDTMVPNANTTAATWGRHQGLGAGIGGVSAAGYGGEFVGGKSHVRLIQVDNANLADGQTAVTGAPTDDAHKIGELFADGAGNLYYNQGEGSNFTKLNNQTMILPDIQRAYDSREEFAEPANDNKGRHGVREVREIDLTEFTDMPASAAGAIINVTVAETDPRGFALVYNGDTDTEPDDSTGSSVNWFEAGEFVANGITVAVSATGTVNLFTLVGTEVIIDVVGYIG